ncbi:uncharacterized protein T551_02707 [Pneumocystis jirovecii RU7]|uniref:Uncharacterized protein n=1 Tax=Pneumocystis jirovecii (strain RU7) TaxID=1408657 RepID=A0A0W4ZIT9_PNEJ7|nr:uncharacterized protein T551_02707 [Pneumocystis jirovecii RU7]KTW28288.1 hypothetical protein T551_02707 [Pneumocystis jirovecii RU7]
MRGSAQRGLIAPETDTIQQLWQKAANTKKYKEITKEICTKQNQHKEPKTKKGAGNKGGVAGSGSERAYVTGGSPAGDAKTVKKHITQLHTYNEIRDVALGLMGKLADQERRRIYGSGHPSGMGVCGGKIVAEAGSEGQNAAITQKVPEKNPACQSTAEKPPHSAVDPPTDGQYD